MGVGLKGGMVWRDVGRPTPPGMDSRLLGNDELEGGGTKGGGETSNSPYGSERRPEKMLFRRFAMAVVLMLVVSGVGLACGGPGRLRPRRRGKSRPGRHMGLIRVPTG